jgi:phosphoribosyl 1,2-cyclic phosphodiesterase
MNNKTISTPQPQTFTGENPFKEKDLVDEPVGTVIEVEETYGHTFKKRKSKVVRWSKEVEVGQKIYTHPAKTLTDEEIAQAWAETKGDMLYRLMPFARAILRKAQAK